MARRRKAEPSKKKGGGVVFQLCLCLASSFAEKVILNKEDTFLLIVCPFTASISRRRARAARLVGDGWCILQCMPEDSVQRILQCLGLKEYSHSQVLIHV